MDGYGRGGHVKYSLKVHLVFVTKYRKKLFYHRVKDDVKQYLYEAASRQGCSIDHVHILIGYSPSHTVEQTQPASVEKLLETKGTVVRRLLRKQYRTIISDNRRSLYTESGLNWHKGHSSAPHKGIGFLAGK